MNILLDQNGKLVSLAAIKEYPRFYCLFVYPYDNFPVEDLAVFNISHWNRSKSEFPYIGVELLYNHPLYNSFVDTPSIADVFIETKEHYDRIESVKKNGYITRIENITELETITSLEG